MAENKNITLAQLRDFAQKTDKRLDALEAGSVTELAFTLAASGWTQNSGDGNYPYQYVLTVEDVTAASRVDAVLDTGSVAVATACGMCPTCETAANTVTFKSYTAPTADLTGTLYVTPIAAAGT